MLRFEAVGDFLGHQPSGQTEVDVELPSANSCLTTITDKRYIQRFISKVGKRLSRGPPVTSFLNCRFGGLPCLTEI